MCAFDITKNKYSSINRDRCIDWGGKLNKIVFEKKFFLSFIAVHSWVFRNFVTKYTLKYDWNKTNQDSTDFSLS